MNNVVFESLNDHLEIPLQRDCHSSRRFAIVVRDENHRVHHGETLVDIGVCYSEKWTVAADDGRQNA
ncbi:hypothetical protein HAX54_044488, partial [Datura stramonium]|nr:hypothetical protein [Datura stramonium]